MLPALTESKAVEGQWAGPTAAPMRLFADKSDPALCAPNVRSPQYLVKVEKNSTVMINALCDDFNVVESACLNLFVYSHSGNGRKKRFPRKDLIVHQEGYLDGDTVSAAVKLRKGIPYVVIPCIMLEEQGDGAKNVTPREGSYSLKLHSMDSITLKELPDFPRQIANMKTKYLVRRLSNH